ncbi:MAG: hypothetical protein AAGK78_02105, partial [Planctomycetota bacterium]
TTAEKNSMAPWEAAARSAAKEAMAGSVVWNVGMMSHRGLGGSGIMIFTTCLHASMRGGSSAPAQETTSTNG